MNGVALVGVVSALVASVAIGCGGTVSEESVDEDTSSHAATSCEPGGRDFVACGESGVCFNGECCDGCWMFACPENKCSLLCMPISECE